MKTGVKLPQFLSKFLNVYSITTVSLGFVLIILFNVHALNKENPVSAQQNFGSCHCNAGNLGCGWCSYNETQEFRDYCQGIADSTGETHIAMCWTTNVLTCETLSGGVCDRQYTYDPDGDGPINIGDYAWQHCGNPVFNPNPPSPPPPSPPPPSDECPYSSTQARVQEDKYHNWYPEITIYEGESFRIGSFHNATGQFASDTRLEISGPSGYSFSCDGTSNDGACNGYTIINVLAGTYKLTVKTYNDDGGFYSESECKDTAKAIVEVKPNPPSRSFTFEKRVAGPASYNEGDTVSFEVLINNTGEVAIDEMYFNDTYNASHLRYLSISGKREKGSFQITQKDLGSYINPQNPSGEYSISDLTEPLGDLGVGETYVITEQFTALSVNTNVYTCNFASAEWSGIYVEDDACITIYKKEEPPTDK